MAWLVLISVFSITVQAVILHSGVGVPVFMLVFFGGFAGGSMLWGSLAVMVGIPYTLGGVAILLLIGIILTEIQTSNRRRYSGLTPVQQLPSYLVAKEDNKRRATGFTCVIDRRIDRRQEGKFLEAVRPLRC